MNQISTVIICLAIIYDAEAGQKRCSIFGDKGCSLMCNLKGQSGGTCDNENKCW